MVFVSFAQNFEDVLLWRALKDRAVGFYVDIGATHPDAGSVTRAFYERGWHGLNVTSLAHAQRRLSASRPRDESLWLAVGRTKGPATLQRVEGSDLATLDADTSDAWAADGHRLTSVAVQMETLQSLLQKHAPADIHFLRIDANGAELEGLAGADLAANRPWILVIRAVAPGSNAATHLPWEPGLLAAGYQFVWFDGVNRFYVAEERALQLAPHFRTPPNILDDFLRVADTELATRIGRSEALAAALADRAAAAETRSRDDTRMLMELRVLNEHRIQQIRSLEQSLVDAHERAGVEAGRTRAANEWLDAVRRSTSWRVTGPVRVLVRRLGRRPALVGEGLPPPPALEALHLPASRTRFEALVGARLAGHETRPAPRRTVHQFHPGSARGDAITNGLLLVQRVLRRLGYESEIYCDQPDPELGAALRPSDELPLHDDYVLLVHFSLGFDNFDTIAGLAAPKVLMYHNITPPEMLTLAPELQALARLGRTQLGEWKPHVAAALAVSEYNALDLRQLGYPVVRSCPLLFDIDAMRAEAAGPTLPRGSGVFTILFVGRIVESKAQDDLVAAFAAFKSRYPHPCQLVLVGRSQATADAFVAKLHALVAELGIANDVIFTGFVDDTELRQWYRDADLYVSLSNHEGFGVPLIEAMAHGLPVLAWPCGAVPYTLDGAAELLFERTPSAVAARIHDLAADPALRQAIVRRQSRSLDRLRLEHHVPVLVEALALAGAALPETVELSKALDANLRFAVTGHINGSYSLATINRGLARSVEAVRPGRVRIIPVEGQVTDDLSGVPPNEAADIRALVARPKPPTGPEVIVSQHYPVHVPPSRADLILALFFWEESVIPLETVRVLNGSFQAVLAPSTFVAKTLVDSGVQVPVHMIGQSPDLSVFRALGAERRARMRPAGPLVFLHVSSCLPRKGVDILIAAFARAFRRADPVQLVIKGYPNPHNDVAEQIASLQAREPDAPEIVFINHDLAAAEFLKLYRNADVMVLPTRGEGFNLPAAEAMAARLPLIVTGFGGQSDFCDAATTRLLTWRFAPSQSHLASGGSLWVEPSEDDLVLALREATVGWTEALATPGAASGAQGARMRAAAARIDATMNDALLVDAMARAAIETIVSPPASPTRMAWITTWGVRCGVAEYARHLLDAWPDHRDVGEIVVIADARTVDDGAAGPRLRVGWQLGSDDNVRSLSKILAQEDPNVVVIQHQPGFFAWPELARLLRTEVLSRRVVVVTLHNTRHLAEIPSAERDDLAAALQLTARVIVHTIADLEVLHGLAVTTNVVMIPHGVAWDEAVDSTPPTPPRALPPSVAPLIGCYGFFLPDKGIPQLIAAVAQLRGTWPGLRLRLVNAAYDTPESAAEIRQCEAQARTAGLGDAIEWFTDFLPEARSRDLLAACDLVVLPYQSSREASSAALRSALVARVPVAVTPLAVFDDAGDAVERLDGTDPAAIADGIARLLVNRECRKESLARAGAWLNKNSAKSVAERMNGMLMGLHRHAQLKRFRAAASHQTR